ncbi:hypothetical protein [Sagittula marina]|uniref:hypothetical protein n=1 Tax=Sagittula marina TaxID=943940 RepID=UPI00336E4985
MHDAQEVPAVVQYAVADVAANVAIATVFGWFDVTRPDIMSKRIKGTPCDAGGFATDKDT